MIPVVEHNIQLIDNEHGYRAVCSCGKYWSKYYRWVARAVNAHGFHARMAGKAMPK